eukprot:5351867-Lingulodinium_polyedra.AAC.1
MLSKSLAPASARFKVSLRGHERLPNVKRRNTVAKMETHVSIYEEPLERPVVRAKITKQGYGTKTARVYGSLLRRARTGH